MIVKFTNKTSTYIFNMIAIIVLFGTIGVYTMFENTSDFIRDKNKKSNIEYINSITSNIVNYIQTATNKQELFDVLKDNANLRLQIEQSLQLFITNRYRYVYVVDRIDNQNNLFRFLLDGSKNPSEKSEFQEEYTPLNIEKWEQVYKTKKVVYFQHNDVQSLWLTYLKPIVVNGKVDAILVVDFSLQDHKNIIESLYKLDQVFEFAVGFSVFLFFIIIFFAYIDHKRIRELDEKSDQIAKFNEELKLKVQEEVAKNREKDQHMMQQNRLAQMGEMISMIAHQWRQPLAAISSTGNALKIKAQLNKLDNNTVVDLAGNILVFAKHLSSTIDDFREFFKKNKDKTDITYTKLIKNVLEIIEISIVDKGITIEQDLQSDFVFHTYTNELKQVLLNLLKNAEDVLIENNIQNPVIKIRTYDNILEVSDNAGGVPEDIMDKIFDPYFSTKMQKDGTGLGLYMSKIIIHEHCGGELKVENTQEGAKFTVALNPKQK